MRIEETFDIAAAPEVVFGRMNNVGDVGYCIAGVQRVDVINDRESRWKITQQVGFMARTFDLDARITGLEPPKRIAFQASGQDVEIVGDLALVARDGPATNCTLIMEIDVVGALAPLVELFAKGPQQALMRQTVANLRATLDGDASAGIPPTGDGTHQRDAEKTRGSDATRDASGRRRRFSLGRWRVLFRRWRGRSS
jgi:carbon monoxide dehydrogenase subunit G